ncbi:MAG TPA: peptidoglycan DD-metalloendopeptidase family protein [Chloroflexi bacterium]|nr:peptidoglycan DD-metalloendopeptidase family protein [Chloroflexota bacterium]
MDFNTVSGPKEQPPKLSAEAQTQLHSESLTTRFWERFKELGFFPALVRAATLIVTILVMLSIVWVLKRFYVNADGSMVTQLQIPNAAQTLLEDNLLAPPLLANLPQDEDPALRRQTSLDTVLPLRSRSTISTYTVEPGDNLFSVATRFNLQPETVLWSNRYNIGDDPHMIYPGQQLVILPVDGTMHIWSAGEGLNGVAEFYKVTPEIIINFPGNNLNMATIGDLAAPNIEPGTQLIIPGGKGEYSDWRIPRITREDPATALNVGPGACPDSYDGVLGTLNFRWPVSERTLTGYDYAPSANHYGIDIGGSIGDPVATVDNGVVVYAGWNDWGYGNMIVVDHGEGWQSLYAHLSTVEVTCGQEVYSGDIIGSVGDTGMADGPHLHFELRNDEYGRVNPWDFLQ